VEYFDYSDVTWEEFDVDRFLEASQQQERELLENELQQVRELLEERKQLHEDVIGELESKLEWYLERLEKKYRRRGSSEIDEVEIRGEAVLSRES
jgi:Uma2 family endonuclease